MEYIVTRDDNHDKLEHYGVKGMKWGIRKNIVSRNNTKRSISGAVIKSGPKDHSQNLPPTYRIKKMEIKIRRLQT